MSPSRPPLRRAAPEHARSGFPFLIGMAALVLAVGVGSVARFCPQDLRFESGGKHPAKTTPTTAAITADAKPSVPPSTPAPSVITPTTFTTIGAPADAPATSPSMPAPKKRSAHAPRSNARATSPTGSASAAASASAALPDNPYPESSPPEAYGF